MQIQTKRVSELSNEEIAFIRHWESRLFGDIPAVKAFKHALSSWHILAWDQGSIVAHLAITQAQAIINDKQLKVGGIVTVFTIPTHRQLGFASTILQEAEQFIFNNMEVDIGMLFCPSEMVAFYAKRDWVLLEQEVWVKQPSGKVIWPEETMVLSHIIRTWDSEKIEVTDYPW